MGAGLITGMVVGGSVLVSYFIKETAEEVTDLARETRKTNSIERVLKPGVLIAGAGTLAYVGSRAKSREIRVLAYGVSSLAVAGAIKEVVSPSQNKDTA